MSQNEKQTENSDKLVLTPDNIFVFCYRPRYRVTEDLVAGEDLAAVKNQCIAYCQRHGITFISVRPAFLDLSKGLRNQQLFQEVESATIVPKK